MKFSLPGFPGRSRSHAAQAGGQDMPQPVADAKPASLVKVRNRILLGAMVLLALLALFIFQLMSISISRAMDREVNITTQQVAARVAAMVDYYGASAALLARDPEISALMLAGDAALLHAREKSLRHVFPTAINVQLLPPGLDQVDMESSPPLSYAAIAQMRLAEAGTREPPMEVHLFNTPQQHINVVRRIMDPAGSRVVGHIMLSLSNDVLQGILDDLQELHGYIELQQAGSKGLPILVATHGDRNYRSGEPARVIPIAGSRWQIAFWPAVTPMVYLGGIGRWVLAALAAAFGLLAILVISMFRKLGNALRVDEVSMVTLLKDFRSGHIRREYPNGLAELRDTLRFMTQLANTHATRRFGAADSGPDGAPAAEPDKPDEPDEAAVKTADAVDYEAGVRADFGSAIRSDNLIVEEEPAEPEAGEAAGSIDPSIFRAYDIRGIVDRTLTPRAVELIGRAIGSEALQRGRNTVVVGRDGRLSGPVLSSALIRGIISTGCDVKDIGCVPTPVLYFATHHLDTRTGVILTGSHNPPDYNGLKIVIDGETLSGESIQSLRERIEAARFISGQGNVESVNIVPDYLERIRGDIKLKRPLRVAIDCGNGVAGNVAPELFRSIGCEVTELFCEVDGNFPNHHPDPGKEDNLRDLIAAVQTQRVDVGLAFDGDGDRLGVVASDGRIVWPDRVLMLYAMDILDRNPGGQVIYDVKCTRFLDPIIRDHGGIPLMWKTGHSFIKAKIKETGALLAGEMSGHIFINERWYGFDDGLYAGVRLLEILAADARSSSEVFAGLPDSVNTPELNVAMQEGEPPVFMKRLLENAHFEGASVSTIDGLRADFDDGWGLVRASNTTPVLVLRFEADDAAALARIMDEFRRVMLQVEPDLKLPF
jgi:phosphomannomutase/phosphoglucomutase